VALARSHVEDVEFSAEDALRSDWAFLAELYSVAIKAGATTLNVPDTVGFTTPSEFRELVKYLRTHVVGSVSLHLSSLNPQPRTSASAASLPLYQKLLGCTLN
jgi:2-isopropylmalate synthase